MYSHNGPTYNDEKNCWKYTVLKPNKEEWCVHYLFEKLTEEEACEKADTIIRKLNIRWYGSNNWASNQTEIFQLKIAETRPITQ